LFEKVALVLVVLVVVVTVVDLVEVLGWSVNLLGSSDFI
jgi:hypothetical protein